MKLTVKLDLEGTLYNKYLLADIMYARWQQQASIAKTPEEIKKAHQYMAYAYTRKKNLSKKLEEFHRFKSFFPQIFK